MKKSLYMLFALACCFAFINNVQAQGDSCLTAVPILAGVHTADGPATGGGWSGISCDSESLDAATNSDWYSFTPASDGLVSVYQCTEDTRVNIHTGTCGNLVCVVGNDDDSTPTGFGACNGVCCGSSVVFPVTNGTEYFIEWDDRWFTGGFTWNLDFHNCVAPTADFAIVNDCINLEYSIEVDLTDMGSAQTVEITNTGGAPVLSGVGAGMHVVGPFVPGTVVELQILHDADVFCNVNFGPITNSPCPTISCGPDNYTHCYGENETTQWVYQSASTFPIALQFSAGGMEACCDNINVYDGENTTAPLLYSGNNGGDLSGLSFISTNVDNFLLLELVSDVSNSCQSGSATPELDWDVACLDCTEPAGSATLINDCPNFQYFVEVEVTGFGDADTVFIRNDAGALDTAVTAVGTYTVGPFVSGADANVLLAHDMNPLCDVAFPTFNNGQCPLVSCGPNNYTYCYTEFDDTQWLFQSASTDPLAIQFTAGGTEATYDGLRVYDGDNVGAPVMFDGDNGGDLSGLVFVSTNPDGYLLMEVYSDVSNSCQSGAVSPEWNWDVACLDCTRPQADYAIVTDCIHREYYVDVDVTDLGDAATVDIKNDQGQPPLLGVGIGTYQIGPFVMDQAVEVSIHHDLNPLCNVYNDTLVAYFDSCAVQCGGGMSTYCYLNSDTAWMLFESGNGMPITLNFQEGEIAAGDQFVLYNGRTTTSALLLNVVNGQNMAGTLIESSNPEGAILMRITSDSLSSCDDGGVANNLEWTIDCGAIGIQESGALSGVMLYPNPTAGALSVQYSGNLHGEMAIDVFDGLGRVVMQKSLAANPGVIINLDLQGLSNGVYTVRVGLDEKNSFERLVLQR